MMAALVVSVPGFKLAKRRERPILATQSIWPTMMGIDGRLVAGSALFGIGWGLVGLCPGPALENLATLSPRVIAFVVAMTAGMALHDFWPKRRPTISACRNSCDGRRRMTSGPRKRAFKGGHHFRRGRSGNGSRARSRRRSGFE